MSGTEAGAGGGATAAPSRDGRRALAAVAAALGLGTLVVFAPLRHAQFLNYDDPLYLTENPYTRGGFSWEGLVWAATDAKINWHPLTWLAHMLDCQLFGLDPGAHHMSAVLLHAVNGVLLLYLLVRLTRRLWPSAFVAALFALHPLHVESVAWVSERKDLLSTFFWLLALLAYVRFVERRTAARHAWVFALTALSLLSKGMAVTMPFLLLMLDYWPLRRWDGGGVRRGLSARELVREKIPLLLLSLAGIVANLLAQRTMGAVQSVARVGFARRALNVVETYAAYLRKTVWPVDLALPYPLDTKTPPIEHVAAAALVLLLLSAGVAWFGRERRYLVTGWLWYLVLLLPVVGFVQLGHQSMADRYTYMPLTGVFVAVAWGVDELTRGRAVLRRAAALAAAVAVASCALLTRRQVAHWHDTVSLFRNAVAVTRDNFYAHNNLAAALNLAGERAEAREHAREALRIDPSNALAQAGLGWMLLEDGRVEEAETYLREAVRLDPSLLVARVYLGLARSRRGDASGAREQFQLAVDAEPRYAAARFGLAGALQAEGNLPRALEEYRRAIEAEPSLEGLHYSYGRALEAAGRTAEAMAEYREERRYRPGHAAASARLRELEAGDSPLFAAEPGASLPSAEERNNAGVGLARAGDLDGAEEKFREALRLRPNYVAAHMNLGVARLQRGDTVGAGEQFAAALAGAPDNALAHLGLAQALEGQGRTAESIAHYEHAVRLMPDSAEAHTRLGLAREASGERDAAVRHLREALRLDPGNAAASAALNRLGAGAQ